MHSFKCIIFYAVLCCTSLACAQHQTKPKPPCIDKQSVCALFADWVLNVHHRACQRVECLCVCVCVCACMHDARWHPLCSMAPLHASAGKKPFVHDISCRACLLLLRVCQHAWKHTLHVLLVLILYVCRCCTSAGRNTIIIIPPLFFFPSSTYCARMAKESNPQCCRLGNDLCNMCTHTYTHTCRWATNSSSTQENNNCKQHHQQNTHISDHHTHNKQHFPKRKSKPPPQFVYPLVLCTPLSSSTTRS